MTFCILTRIITLFPLILKSNLNSNHEIQWWNMFFNCSIFLRSVQNWDKKLQVLFLRSLSHIFNDKWSTWDKFGSYETQSFQQIKVLIEFVIISDILLLTCSYNYFFNIFLVPKAMGWKPNRSPKIIPLCHILSLVHRE